MTYRVLDIETVPQAASMLMPYPLEERQPPSNYKNADAIEAWRERDRAAWAEQRAKECSINPRLGRVLAIGTCTFDDESVLYAIREDQEREILTQWWELLQDERIVTWNGGWDLRFLKIRSIINGVCIPVSAERLREWERPYNTAAHCDVKRVLVGENAVKGEGLDEWSQALGAPGKADGWDGSKVFPAYLQGRHQEILEYCLLDVRATRRLYSRVLRVMDL